MTSTHAVQLWEIEQAGGPANSTEAILMHEAELKASASPPPGETGGAGRAGRVGV